MTPEPTISTATSEVTLTGLIETYRHAVEEHQTAWVVLNTSAEVLRQYLDKHGLDARMLQRLGNGDNDIPF